MCQPQILCNTGKALHLKMFVIQFQNPNIGLRPITAPVTPTSAIEKEGTKVSLGLLPANIVNFAIHVTD